MARTKWDKSSSHRRAATTLAELLRDREPMGDLRRFVIPDLEPDEEDAFYAALEAL